MPHCHRGGGGVRWNILSEEKLDCVGALAALHSRLEHEEKGKKKKKKRGILSLYIPPEQPGVHSVSKKEKIGFVILIFFSHTDCLCLFAGGGIPAPPAPVACIGHHLCYKWSQRGNPPTCPPPPPPPFLSLSPSSLLPPLRAEEHRRGERMSRTLRV